MKKFNLKRIAKAVCAFAMIAAVVVPTGLSAAAASNDKIGKYDYSITNPYQEIDWRTWNAYKSATHVHTVRSDGNVELDDMIEKYYSLGYQGLALTDHGTVNYSWTKNQTRLAIFGYQYFVHGNVDEISEARYKQITTGSDRGGDAMIEIPLGIELNGSSTIKCHVNSYFVDVGHGDLGINEKWPENAVKKSNDAGGISHINHVGEWAEAKSDISIYNEDFVQRFSSIFLKYPGCVGMELVNTTDNRTRNDRYLYDETLKKVAPTGRNVFGFCEDDAHDYEDCANNAQFFIMPENTAQNVRHCMETGAFFCCSKNAKTPNELGDGFQATDVFPTFSKIEVDEETDQISFTVNEGEKIKMVADGQVIATQNITRNNQVITFDLNRYEDSINSYVRFYMTGQGGICYAQPFLLTKANYPKSTVHFNLSDEKGTFVLRDSLGNIMKEVNDEHYYTLDAGTYTYTATLDGCDTINDTITVTADDIKNANQLSKDIIFREHLIYGDEKTTVDYFNDLLYGIEYGSTDVSSQVKIPAGAKINYTNTSLGFGTGAVIDIVTSDYSHSYTLVIFGDVNGDGKYDGQDAVVVNALVDGLLSRQQVGEAVFKAADCNHDNAVDVVDIDLITNSGISMGTISQR